MALSPSSSSIPFRSRHANRTHIIFYKRINGTVSCLYHLKLCAHGRDMLVFRMNTPTHRAPGRSVNIHIHKHAQHMDHAFHTVMCANAIFARPQTNVFTSQAIHKSQQVQTQAHKQSRTFGLAHHTLLSSHHHRCSGVLDMMAVWWKGKIVIRLSRRWKEREKVLGGGKKSEKEK